MLHTGNRDVGHWHAMYIGAKIKSFAINKVQGVQMQCMKNWGNVTLCTECVCLVLWTGLSIHLHAWQLYIQL